MKKKYKLFGLLVFFLALFGPAGLKADELTMGSAVASAPEPVAFMTYVNPALQNADNDLVRGDWRRARKQVLEELHKDKKSAAAWVLLARTYLPKQKYAKAVRRCRKGLKYDPHYAPGYYWRGDAFEKWGKLDEAANEYQAALRADPGFAAAKAAWYRLKDKVSIPND